LQIQVTKPQPPELIIPQGLAKGHWKDALKKATIETYISLFGSGRLRSIGVGKIKVITGTKQSKDVQAKIIVSKHEKELVLNDKLISALGIELINVGAGRWRFADDPPSVERDSALG
jgi:hypothetical protein